jgi:hypothetical protein
MKQATGKANGGERSEERSFRPGGRDNRLKRLNSGKKTETEGNQALFLERFGRSLGRLGSIRKNLDCLGNPIIIHNDIE